MVGLSIRGKDKAKVTPNLVCILKYFVSERSASPVLSQAKPLLRAMAGKSTSLLACVGQTGFKVIGCFLLPYFYPKERLSVSAERSDAVGPSGIFILMSWCFCACRSPLSRVLLYFYCLFPSLLFHINGRQQVSKLCEQWPFFRCVNGFVVYSPISDEWCSFEYFVHAPILPPLEMQCWKYHSTVLTAASYIGWSPMDDFRMISLNIANGRGEGRETIYYGKTKFEK